MIFNASLAGLKSKLNDSSPSLPPENRVWRSHSGEIEPRWGELAQAAGYDLQELAKLLGVSLRTLQRHFARHGLRASTWMRELRLKASYGRLLKGERVKEVAYDLGYSQLSNFARDFKRRFGVAPSTLSDASALLPPLPAHSSALHERPREEISSFLTC